MTPATPHRAARMNDCAACGEPCPPHQRWCSFGCFVEEDGYPDDVEAEDDNDD